MRSFLKNLSSSVFPECARQGESFIPQGKCLIMPILLLVIIFIVVKKVTKLNNFLSGSIVFGLLVLLVKIEDKKERTPTPTQ